jgi:hypothetical protein
MYLQILYEENSNYCTVIITTEWCEYGDGWLVSLT